MSDKKVSLETPYPKDVGAFLIVHPEYRAHFDKFVQAELSRLLYFQADDDDDLYTRSES